MKKQQAKQATKKNWFPWVLIGLVVTSIGVSTSLLVLQTRPQILLCRIKSADPITGLIELECAK